MVGTDSPSPSGCNWEREREVQGFGESKNGVQALPQG